jgi:hypothetical protein
MKGNVIILVGDEIDTMVLTESLILKVNDEWSIDFLFRWLSKF